MLTQERLKEVLYYSPGTGEWTWLQGNYRGYEAGKSGTQINIDRKRYYPHRLAWLYMTGAWPSGEVDHINRDPIDNRWCNLRECDRSQNMMNTDKYSTNTSGIKGVSPYRYGWLVQVSGRHKKFKCKEKAEQYAIKLRKELHGEFANHG